MINNPKNELSVELVGEKATADLGARISELLRSGDVVYLIGDLGTGKSTFARGIFHALKFTGPFASPTYTYAIEYPDNVIHLDMYMVDNQNFYVLGLDEYFDADNICIVEWADKLPDSFRYSGRLFKLEFHFIDTYRRTVFVQLPNGVSL